MIQTSENAAQQGADQISGFRQELVSLSQNHVFDLMLEQQAIENSSKFYSPSTNTPSMSRAVSRKTTLIGAHKKGTI